MDFADGELLRTRETVVWESSKCSASVLRLTCPAGSALFLLAMLDVVARLARTRNLPVRGNTSIFSRFGPREAALVSLHVVHPRLEFKVFTAVGETPGKDSRKRDGRIESGRAPPILNFDVPLRVWKGGVQMIERTQMRSYFDA